jgi:hypothetical protein
VSVQSPDADVNNGIQLLCGDGVNDTDLKIMSKTSTLDYFKIETKAAGETTFTTNDNSAAAGNLIFKIDGDLKFNPVNSQKFIINDNAITSTDTIFLCSGSIGSKGSASDRGTAVFGGDLVVSGNFHARSNISLPTNASIFFENSVSGDGPFIVGTSDSILNIDADNYLNCYYDFNAKFYYTSVEQLELGNAGFVWNDTGLSSNAYDFRVETNTLQGAINIDSGTDQILLGTNSTDAAGESLGTDVNIFMSGSTGSKDTAIKGTSLFGGDLVASGYHWSAEIDASTSETFLGISPTDASAGLVKWKHQRIAPYSGTIKKFFVRSSTGDGSNAIRVKFYRSQGADASTSGTVATEDITASSANTTYDASPSSNTAISSGDVFALSVQRSTNPPDMINVTVVVEYDIFS